MTEKIPTSLCKSRTVYYVSRTRDTVVTKKSKSPAFGELPGCDDSVGSFLARWENCQDRVGSRTRKGYPLRT